MKLFVCNALLANEAVAFLWRTVRLRDRVCINKVEPLFSAEIKLRIALKHRISAAKRIESTLTTFAKLLAVNADSSRLQHFLQHQITPRELFQEEPVLVLETSTTEAIIQREPKEPSRSTSPLNPRYSHFKKCFARHNFSTMTATKLESGKIAIKSDECASGTSKRGLTGPRSTVSAPAVPCLLQLWLHMFQASRVTTRWAPISTPG